MKLLDYRLTDKVAAKRQIMFVKNEIISCFPFENSSEVVKFIGNISVCGTHRSESITLPAYKFHWNGIKFTMRCNFHDWKVTVESDRPLSGLEKYRLFRPDVKWDKLYCEGMDTVLDSYSDSNQNFTVAVNTDYDLYTLLKVVASC